MKDQEKSLKLLTAAVIVYIIGTALVGMIFVSSLANIKIICREL